MIKPSRSSQSWIQRIRPVCRTNDDDRLFARREVIHTCQELSYDTAFHFPLSIFTFGGDGVDFVQKEDTRCDFLRGSCQRGAVVTVTEMKDMFTLASSNVSLNVFSDSPDMPDTMDGADTEIKGNFISYIGHQPFPPPPFFSSSPIPQNQTHTCQALYQLCLTTTRHTMQQHTLWPGDTRMQVDLRVEKGEGGDFE